jgi:hypothetical protein
MGVKLVACVFAAGLLLTVAPAAPAATPSSGKIAPSGKLAWDGPFTLFGMNISGGCQGDPGAVPVVDTCDVYELTVAVPSGYYAKHKGGVDIRIRWSSSANEFDLLVFRKPPPGLPVANPVAASTQSGTNEQEVRIRNAQGTYLVRVRPTQVVGDSYHGTASFFSASPIPKVRGGLTQYRASHGPFLSYSEPFIAINPRNPNNLVAGSKMYQNLDAYKFKIGTFVSFDAGRHWTDNGILPGFPRQTGSDPNYYLTSDVWLAFDNFNDAYAIVLDNPSGSVSTAGWGMTLEKSRNGGRTWSGPIPIHRNNGLLSSLLFFDDKDAIAVDNTNPTSKKPGNLYTCWSFDAQAAVIGANLAIAVSSSTDAGRTWSPAPDSFPRAVSGLDRSVVGCQLAIGPPARRGHPGTLYVFWLNFGTSTIRMVKSNDGGATYSPPQTVATIDQLPPEFPNSAFRNLSAPAVGVDPRTGAVYVAWSDYHETKPGTDCPPATDAPRGQVCDGDILLTRSTNGGASWSAPIRVNQDRVGSGKDQFQPALAVSPNGTLNMMWFDRRNDPGDYYIDTYVGVSRDHGTHWKETRVTKTMWDPSINPPLAVDGQFIGDYQGIAASNSFAFPFWQDTTMANLRPSDRRYSRYQQVFSARVPNTQPRPKPRPKPKKRRRKRP